MILLIRSIMIASMIRFTTQQQQQPFIAHYDFTTTCRVNNHTITNDDDIINNNHNNIIIHPVMTSTDSNNNKDHPSSLSLISNHPNVFYCDTNDGLFLYTPTNIYGVKNRLESSSDGGYSTNSDCDTSTLKSNNTNNGSSTASDTNNEAGSSNDTQSLLLLLQQRWSIVLWIQPNDSVTSSSTHSARRRSILTMSNSRTSSISDDDDENDFMMTTMIRTIRLVQYDSQIAFILGSTTTTSASNSDSTLTTTIVTTLYVNNGCYGTLVPSNNQQTHIVVVGTNKNAAADDDGTIGDVQIYINGQPMDLERQEEETTTISYDVPTAISTNDTRSPFTTIQLFSNDDDDDENDVFLGSLYQLDLYNNIALTYDDSMSLYEYGVGWDDDINNKMIGSIAQKLDEHDINTTEKENLTIPFYYDDDIDDVFLYSDAAEDYVVSKTRRPLIAKPSTTLSTPIQQVGMVVRYQNSILNSSRSIAYMQHEQRCTTAFATMLELHSYNHSNTVMQLGIQITSITTHGLLDVPLYDDYDHQNSTTTTVRDNPLIVATNDIYLLHGNETSIRICYQLRLEAANVYYFNVPKHDGYGMDLHHSPESFSYRIVEIPIVDDGDDYHHLDSSPPLAMTTTTATTILKSSEIVTIPIYVVHVNDGRNPPTIIVDPKQQEQNEQTNNDQDNDDSAPTPMLVLLNDHQVMIQNGIDVMFGQTDDDYYTHHNLDHVRVDVFTSSSREGTIALDPNRVSLLLSSSDIYKHCTQRYYSDWQCTKFSSDNNNTSTHDNADNNLQGESIMGSSHITMIALPNDVPILLQQMIYTSSHLPGGQSVGNVTVRIYYGTGSSDCLHAKEHYWYYNYTNPQPSTISSATSNWTATRTAIIRDYILAGTWDDSSHCTMVEATIPIPNSVWDYTQKHNRHKHDPKEFMIFGFVWKEFVFGMLFVSIFVFCYCGCCTIPRKCWRCSWSCCRRPIQQQLNYNDYID